MVDPRVLALALLLVGACGVVHERTVATDAPFLASEDACARPRQVDVACVIDGDTLDLDACGTGERVRLLGIDAPELAHDGAPADCFAGEATGALAALMPDITRATFDALCTDAFGRTLAWAWVDPEAARSALGDAPVALAQALHGDTSEDAVSVSTALLAAGFVRRFDPGWQDPVRYEGALAEAARDADAHGRGLWSACRPPDPGRRSDTGL